MLCDKCHQAQNNKPVKNCEFCSHLDFSEEILCYIARNGAKHENLSECGAYKPKLSIVSPESKQHLTLVTESENPEALGFSNKDKWFGAYAKQQLQFNPEKVQFNLSYHICLVTKQRKNIFSYSPQYFEKVTAIFQQIMTNFENSGIELLWICSDHMHFFLSTTPDYSIDELIEKLISDSTQAIHAIDTEQSSELDNIWEAGYFAESIG